MSNTGTNRSSFVRASDPTGVTIRAAVADDFSALERLAQLDSSRIPAGPVVIAEVDDELLAAYVIDENRVIADPFRRTTELIALLELRARQLNGGRRGSGRKRRSVAPQPPGFGLGLLHPRLGRRTA
jgi:hypothetical protein